MALNIGDLRATLTLVDQGFIGPLNQDMMKVEQFAKKAIDGFDRLETKSKALQAAMKDVNLTSRLSAGQLSALQAEAQRTANQLENMSSAATKFRGNAERVDSVLTLTKKSIGGVAQAFGGAGGQLVNFIDGMGDLAGAVAGGGAALGLLVAAGAALTFVIKGLIEAYKEASENAKIFGEANTAAILNSREQTSAAIADMTKQTQSLGDQLRFFGQSADRVSLARLQEQLTASGKSTDVMSDSLTRAHAELGKTVARQIELQTILAAGASTASQAKNLAAAQVEYAGINEKLEVQQGLVERLTEQQKDLGARRIAQNAALASQTSRVEALEKKARERIAHEKAVAAAIAEQNRLLLAQANAFVRKFDADRKFQQEHGTLDVVDAVTPEEVASIQTGINAASVTPPDAYDLYLKELDELSMAAMYASEPLKKLAMVTDYAAEAQRAAQDAMIAQISQGAGSLMQSSLGAISNGELPSLSAVGSALGFAAAGPMGSEIAGALGGLFESTFGAIVDLVGDQRATAGAGAAGKGLAVAGSGVVQAASLIAMTGPVGMFLTAISVIVAPLIVLGAVFFELSQSTKSFAAFQARMGDQIDRLVKALEPLWQKSGALVPVFARLIDGVIPLATAFAENELIMRLFFEAIRGVSVAILLMTDAAARFANTFLGQKIEIAGIDKAIAVLMNMSFETGNAAAKAAAKEAAKEAARERQRQKIDEQLGAIKDNTGATASSLNLPEAFKVAQARAHATDADGLGSSAGSLAGSAGMREQIRIYINGVEVDDMAMHLDSKNRLKALVNTGIPFHSPRRQFSIPKNGN